MSNKPNLIRSIQLPPTLYMQKYERYLPTAFDESLSILEKINKVIHFLYEYSVVTEEMMVKWNEVYNWVMNEGLDQAVGDRLKEWVDNGTLEKIINDKLLEGINDKVDNFIKQFDELKKELEILIESDLGNFKEEIDNKISLFVNRLNDFNLMETKPTFYTNFKMKIGTIMQSFVYNYRTEEFYAIQLNGYYKNPYESYTLCRFSKSGNFIDSMDLVGGGHGVSFGIENRSDRVIIWSNYTDVDNNNQNVGTKLVSFEYVANRVIYPNSPYLKTENKFTNKYVLPSIDELNDRICFRVSSDGKQHLEIRKLSDVKRGIDNVLYAMDIPSDLIYLQGFSLDGDFVYWYTGDTNGKNYPIEITVFDVKNNKIKERKSVDFGKNNEGYYDGNFREPEGCYIFTHPITKAKSLFLGIITDTSDRRQNKIYGYHSLQNESYFLGNRTQGIQNHPLTNNSGFTKEIPSHIKSLEELQDAGFYYMSTEESKRFSDHPAKGIAGWYLEVYPPLRRGVFYQVLRRASTHPHNSDIYYKMYGSNAEWELINGSPKWHNVPLGVNFTEGNPSLQVAFSSGRNEVSLRGYVELTGSYEYQTLIGTLPKQFRPSQWQYLMVKTDKTNETSLVVVKNDGRIELYQPVSSGTRIYFYGIQFYTN